MQVASVAPSSKMFQHDIASCCHDFWCNCETLSGQSKQQPPPKIRKQNAMGDYRYCMFVGGKIRVEQRQQMLVQKIIGPFCHRILTFDINKAFIIFMFVAMCFAPSLLRVCRPSLE
jgi:hypothetical protein